MHTFSQLVWQRSADIRERIDQLDLLNQLRTGELSRERFENYMTQDQLYLAEYSRVLAGLATQAPDQQAALLWAESSRNCVLVESQLHQQYADDQAVASPTCVAYTSYLTSRLVRGGYPVAVAGVLPCYWIYQDVGERLLAGVDDLAAHPFGEWITTYGDEVFAASVVTARAIADECHRTAGEPVRRAMEEAYLTASRYEWMFWDAAHRMERWPL